MHVCIRDGDGRKLEAREGKCSSMTRPVIYRRFDMQNVVSEFAEFVIALAGSKAARSTAHEQSVINPVTYIYNPLGGGG